MKSGGRQSGRETTVSFGVDGELHRDYVVLWGTYNYECIHACIHIPQTRTLGFIQSSLKVYGICTLAIEYTESFNP